MYLDRLPSRVRLLILGGGIHGVGVLHDVVSRGWKDVHLIEKFELGHGSSRRSTKLLQGGFSQLKSFSNYPLIAESLRERKKIMDLAPDLSYHVELIIPLRQDSSLPGSFVRSGLIIYDFLAGSGRLARYRSYSLTQAQELAPCLNIQKLNKVYSFWEILTDDLALTRRVARSAHMLGAGITEDCEVVSVAPDQDGWLVRVRQNNVEADISALYVINALGQHSHDLLASSDIIPEVQGIKANGYHILLPDIGLKAGLLMESPVDRRAVLALPWKGMTLIGAGEVNSKKSTTKDEQIDYLLHLVSSYFSVSFKRSDILGSFVGTRWNALEGNHQISAQRRNVVISEKISQRGMMMGIYGGGLTTYRLTAEKIGNRVTHHFGEFLPSQTSNIDYWAVPDSSEIKEEHPSEVINRYL